MEDYLAVIYHLCQEGGLARVKDIAERRAVSSASVVGAIKNLKRRKLIRQERYGYIRLTESGREIAASMLHKQEVLSKFLEKILGLDPESASRDASKMEHAVSPAALKGLADFIEFIEAYPRFENGCLEPFKEFRRYRRSAE